MATILRVTGPYRPPGRSSPGGGSSRGVGGAVGVTPRLSGRSSPGGGSSLGGTSSALGGPGATTTSSSSTRGAASTSSSGPGGVGAVSLLLLPLPSRHNKSKISVAIARRQRLATQRYRRLLLRAARFFLLRIAPIRFVGRWWPALGLGYACFFFVRIVPTCFRHPLITLLPLLIILLALVPC